MKLEAKLEGIYKMLGLLFVVGFSSILVKGKT